MTFDKLLQQITSELASEGSVITFDETTVSIDTKYELQEVITELCAAIGDLTGSEIATLLETIPLTVFRNSPRVAAALLGTRLVIAVDAVHLHATGLASKEWTTELLEHLAIYTSTAQEYLDLALDLPGVSLCGEFFLENRKGLLIGATSEQRDKIIKLGLIPRHRVVLVLICHGGKCKEIIRLVKVIGNPTYTRCLTDLAQQVGRKKLHKQLDALVEAELSSSIIQVEMRLSDN